MNAVSSILEISSESDFVTATGEDRELIVDLLMLMVGRGDVREIDYQIYGFSDMDIYMSYFYGSSWIQVRLGYRSGFLYFRWNNISADIWHLSDRYWSPLNDLFAAICPTSNIDENYDFR